MKPNLAIYRKIFGLEGAAFSEIHHSEGIVATVFKIESTQNVTYILKICSRPKDYFCETYFLKYFSNLLPIPRIVALRKPEKNIPGAILLEYLSGALLTASDLTPALATEIGRCLAQIHLHKANGYGDLTQPQQLVCQPDIYFTAKWKEEL